MIQQQSIYLTNSEESNKQDKQQQQISYLKQKGKFKINRYSNSNENLNREVRSCQQLFDGQNKVKYFIFFMSVFIIVIICFSVSQQIITKIKMKGHKNIPIPLQPHFIPIKPNLPPARQTPTPRYIPKPPTSTAGIIESQRLQAIKLLKLKAQQYDNNQGNLTMQQKSYYQQKYNICKYEELPFCIVVPTFNNVKNNRYLNNIRSIIMQDYVNYHVVVIDDASTDGTGEMIREVLRNQSKITEDRYQIIVNQVNMKAMPNIRRAAQQFCKPEEIFMIVDGDDEIVGKQVLKLFNSAFQKQNAWFVYSNFLHPSFRVGYSRPFPQKIIKQNRYRKHPFVTSHLRAFYTKLFLNIKEQDLKDKSNNYLKAANDVAICIPILQQSHTKVVYLKQLTYFYNSNTGLNNHKVRIQQQKSNNVYIRTKRSYKDLKDLNQTAGYVDEDKNNDMKYPKIKEKQVQNVNK